MNEESMQELEIIAKILEETSAPFVAEAPDLNAAISRLLMFCGKMRADQLQIIE